MHMSRGRPKYINIEVGVENNPDIIEKFRVETLVTKWIIYHCEGGDDYAIMCTVDSIVDAIQHILDRTQAR